MASVYILYSKAIDAYYTGSCVDISQSLQQHLEQTFLDSYTRKASDWILHLSIDHLEYQQARKIEKHIKSMKSRKYIEDLKRYPEMVLRLVEKYSAGSSFTLRNSKEKIFSNRILNQS